MSRRTLIVTNDFPPRIGGIESFVADVCRLLDGDVVVYASGPPEAAGTDAAYGFPVVRAGQLLLPTPVVARTAARLLREHGASRVVFGAAAPLGLLAPALRRAGAEVILGLTHGHEVWWANVPGSRKLLRRIGDACDHLTTISDYTTARIGPALSPAARDRLVRLPPPVDTERFTPDPDRPLRSGRRCVAVGRFVAQKGFADLLRAWAIVVEAEPAARLRLIGDGPQRAELEQLTAQLGLTGQVEFPGPLARNQVIEELRRADVFALPVRTRLAGLNPEGLGLAALEAAACGLPVLIGASGGAPETVRDGISGWALPGDDHRAWAGRILELFGAPIRARAMGEAGRAYVVERYGFDRARRTLGQALEGSDRSG